MSTVPLEIDRGKLAELCRRHGIQRLAVFGSAARDQLEEDSDVDILVEFQPGETVGLRFMSIQYELSDLLGRPVDLATPAFLSRHFRQGVLEEAIPIYEAA